MKLGILITILVFCNLYASAAVAAGSSSKSGSQLLILEGNTWFGYGNSQIASDTSVPSVGSFNLGGSVGVNIRRIGLGVNYQYRIITQHSAIDPSVGNRRGTITTMAPFVNFNFEKFKLGLTYFISGRYDLQNITSTGQKLAYTSPSGFKFDFRFGSGRVKPTIFYESMAFSGMELDNTSAAFTDKLNYTNYGIGLVYAY